MLYGGYRVVHEVEAAPQKPIWGQERHVSALDVAAGQLLGYRTRAGGDNRPRACPGETQLLGSSVCALQPHRDFIVSI